MSTLNDVVPGTEVDSDAAVSEKVRSLQARKADLYTALRTLERDRADETIEKSAYEASRRRYESEAAVVLEELDRLMDHGQQGLKRTRRRRSGWISAVAVLSVLAILAALLFNALHNRSDTGVVTGDSPPAIATPAPEEPAGLAAARRRVQQHPRNVDARLDVGTVFYHAGRLREADRQFARAMQLDPSRPEPITLHALILGVTRSGLKNALSLLTTVEARHPRYARAWLEDGLLSSEQQSTHRRAITALHRFLMLQPRTKVTPEVQSLLMGLRKAERHKP